MELVKEWHTGSVEARVINNDRHDRACVRQGAGGKYASVGQKKERRRGGKQAQKRRVKGQRRRVDVRIGTLNVGTMTGKERELADMMERRKLDIFNGSYQESRRLSDEGTRKG